MSFSSFMVVAGAADGLEIFHFIRAVSGERGFVIYLGGWLFTIGAFKALFSKDASSKPLPLCCIVEVFKSAVLKEIFLRTGQAKAVPKPDDNDKVGAFSTQGNVAPGRVVTICCLELDKLFQELSTAIHRQFKVFCG